MKQENMVKFLFKVVTIVVTLLLIVFVLYGLHLGIFQDKMILVNYMIRKIDCFLWDLMWKMEN